jgi:DNA-binding NarL/FixJ family response regulator
LPPDEGVAWVHVFRRKKRTVVPARPRPSSARVSATAASFEDVEDAPIAHRVLIVEDEPDMQHLLRILLAADRRLVIAGQATSAAEALAVVEAAPVDVVILDHGIRGAITGLELAPLLRRSSPEARIVLFTARDLADAAAGVEAIDAYLRKDAVATLLPLVHKLLRLSPVSPR